MRKIIVLNGVGNHDAGWSDPFRVHELLRVPKEQVIEFVYEDLFDNHWTTKFLMPLINVFVSKYTKGFADSAVFTLQDYVSDLFLYFLPFGVRSKIVARLLRLIENHPDCVIIGFSLGSVIAYEACQELLPSTMQPVLITTGSPLGGRFLAPLIKQRLGIRYNQIRPCVDRWLNIYSDMDPVSGKIKDMNCRTEDQYKIPVVHSLPAYLEFVPNVQLKE